MRRRHALGLLAAPLLAPAVRAQTALLPVRFSLDWAFLGPQAAFLLALDRGHFREAGLDVTMDRGFGSGDVPLKILSGAYDVGVADINPTIRLRLERPDADIFTPFIVYDATALAILALRRSGIRRPADLAGRTIAAPESDAGRQLFPAFARAAGLDAGAVRWMTVTPQLREPMLVQGRADAIAGFTTAGIFSLRGLGVRDEEIVTLNFSDVGADFYSTALLTTRRFAEAHPRAVTGLIRGLARAQHEAFRDPTAAIAVLRRREPLTDVALETERLRISLEQLTFTPHVRRNGFGQVDMARLQRSIDMVRDAFGITQTLAAGALYDPRFLPPESEMRPA